MKLNNKYIANCITIFIVICSLCMISGCSNKKKIISQCEKENNYGYTIECDNTLFYYHISPETVDLYSYDIESEKKNFIDNVANSEMEWSYFGPMHLIDGRIYYMKAASSYQTVDFYSIDPEKYEPQYEGTINNSVGNYEWIDYGERAGYLEIEMFKYDGSIYVFAQKNIYKLDKKKTSIVKSNIISMYIDGDNIYYSALKDKKDNDDKVEPGGISRYDINTGKSDEIVAADDIERLNDTELLQDSNVVVRNIIADDENIYFLGTSGDADIFRYNQTDEKSLSILTPDLQKRLTQKFRKYDDKIYYIAVGNRLHCVDLTTRELNAVIDQAYIYAYNIYNDSLYYYKVTDNRNYPSEIRVYDLSKGTDMLIDQFQ